LSQSFTLAFSLRRRCLLLNPPARHDGEGNLLFGQALRWRPLAMASRYPEKIRRRSTAHVFLMVNTDFRADWILLPVTYTVGAGGSLDVDQATNQARRFRQ